jgi:hypothetical protein
VLFKNSMSNVDENANAIDSSSKNPITSDESNEDEVKHNRFEFSLDDKIPFSRLLFDPMVLSSSRV